MKHQTGLGIFDVADPPPLPSPNPFAHWLFEAPLFPSILLITVGVTLFLVLNSRAQARQGLFAALAASALAATLLITASLVTTPREALIARTRELVAATARSDGAAVGALLHPECVLVEPLSQRELTRDETIDAVATRLHGFGITEHAVLEVQAQNDNTRFGRVQVKVRVTAQGAGPNLSWWNIEFESDESGSWRAVRIRALAIAGLRAV